MDENALKIEIQDWLMAAFDVLEDAKLAVTTGRVEVLAYLTVLMGGSQLVPPGELFKPVCLQRFLRIKEILANSNKDNRLNIIWQISDDLNEILFVRRSFSEHFIGGVHHQYYEMLLKVMQVTDLSTEQSTIQTGSALEGIIQGESPYTILRRTGEALRQLNPDGYRFAKKFLPGTLETIITFILETTSLPESTHLANLRSWLTAQQAVFDVMPPACFGLMADH